jgi:hypothetical protein
VLQKPVMLLVCSALVVGLVSCGDSADEATLPTPLPTESFGRAVCDARGRVFDVVGQVQTGAVESKADVAARLRTLAEQLDSEAERLRSQDLAQAAKSVAALSTATSQLAAAVEGTDPSAIVAAAARAASAVQAIPGCPSPSPSSSPTPSASPST